MKYLYKNKYWKPNKEYNLDKLLYLMTDRPDGIVRYYHYFVWRNKKDQIHRNYDLPSFVTDNYSVHWYKNDILSRDNNKLSIIGFDGYQIVSKNIKSTFIRQFVNLIQRLVSFMINKIRIN